MTSPTPLPPIEVGTRLTDFASLDLIVEGGAEGGFGLVVWGPNQANGNQMSALKLPRPDLLASANAQSTAEGERMRREFEREALTWCHLWPHANIIIANGLTRLPGWGDMPVLVLEYASGGSLRHALTKAHSSRTGHLSLEAALTWGQQVAAALAVIHQPDLACERPEPLVHCDLKPENVLLNARGWALLTDLGLTRAYATTSTMLTSSTSSADLTLDAMSAGQMALGEQDIRPDQDTREARVARMRSALQAAGLLPDAPANTPTLSHDRRLDRRFVTRSVRVPPLSAALVATVLAPQRAASSGDPSDPSDPAAPAAPARAVDTARAAQATEPGVGSRGPVAGTPPYMAPEQWWGLDAVTPASDVYALGVLLFELFTGGAWSPQQQCWLAENLGETGTSSTEERYVRFPHAPQFNAEALAYLDGWGGVAGQQAYFAAWYAAHRAGPRWRLADPAIGALTRGPLVDMVASGSHNGPHAGDAAQQAVTALQALSELIADCLAPIATQRPTAETVRVRLAGIARLVGKEPLVIPEVFSRISEREAAFLENLGITYTNIGQHEERLRLQRRVVALDPDNPQRWMNLGNGFYKLERYEEALAAYTEAERRLTPAYQARDPQRAALVALAISSNQASALGAMERYEEAVAAYRRVLEQRPDWVDTRFSLAVTFVQWSQAPDVAREERLERLQVAQREAQQALVDAPGYTKAQALLGQIERAVARLERE